MHLRLRTRTPARLLIAAALAALAAGGCDDFLVAPAKAPARLSVSYTFTPGSPAAQVGVARAFDRVDRLRIYIARGEEEGDEVLFDEFFTVSGAGGEIRQTVSVPLERNEEELFLGVALLAGESPVFKGSRQILLVAGQESSAEVPLQPVAATLSIAPVPIFPSLGDSMRAAAVALFATGDTVDGALIAWSGPDSGILEVRPSGWMVARAEGQARLVATFGDAFQEVSVQVRATPASLVVTPDTVTVMRADTVRFRATVRDARGNLLARNPAWTSHLPSRATVDAGGLVTAVAPGEARIRARLDPLADSGKVFVLPRRGDLVPRVANALNNVPVIGAFLQVRRGANATPADSVVATATTDESGHARISLFEGPYTLTVSKNGFIDETVPNLVVVGGEELLRNVIISPVVPPGQTRIVLTWGTDPDDLDAHLTGPDSIGGTFHVYFSNPGSDSTLPYAQLDTDDTDSFGPETVTIYRQFAGDYCFSVHHYSGAGTLGTSGAQVRVFRGNQEIASLSPPPETTARVWTAFKLNASAVFPVNTTSASPPGTCSAPPVVNDVRTDGAALRLPAKPGGR